MTMRYLLMALGLGALSGCLLPDPPAPPRLFAPVSAMTAPHGTVAGPALRIRPVRSPIYLRDAMAWQRNDTEFGTYAQRLWTEQPATYVERALDDALAAAGVAVVTSDEAPALTVELRRFEEVLAPSHEAAVAVDVELAADAHVALRRSFESRQPLTGDDPVELARAIGTALDQVAADAARAIRAALPSARPVPRKH